METAFVEYEVKIAGKKSHNVAWFHNDEDHIRANVALQFDIPESEIEVREIG